MCGGRVRRDQRIKKPPRILGMAEVKWRSMRAAEAGHLGTEEPLARNRATQAVGMSGSGASGSARQRQAKDQQHEQDCDACGIFDQRRGFGGEQVLYATCYGVLAVMLPYCSHFINRL